jgi:hypothetical protein
MPATLVAQEQPAPAAQAPATDQPAPASTGTSDLDRMVCRSGRPLIGTRFPGPRICKTQRQWDSEMQTAQHNLSKDQIRGCDPNRGCNH